MPLYALSLSHTQPIPSCPVRTSPHPTIHRKASVRYGLSEANVFNRLAPRLPSAKAEGRA
ncbi:hypothetical protein BDV11DRAFT_177731 [Aspergillus similis]